MEGTNTEKKDTAEKTIINIGELLKKPYLNEFESAALSGRAVSTLRNERHLRRGLPYLKIRKRSIRYKTADVLSFMEARRISFDDAR
jgi:hypothetical protein